MISFEEYKKARASGMSREAIANQMKQTGTPSVPAVQAPAQQVPTQTGSAASATTGTAPSGMSLLDQYREARASGMTREQIVEQFKLSAPQQQSYLSTTPYAHYLGNPDYAEYSQAGGSKIKLFGGDQRYDYINNINNFKLQTDAQMRAGDWGKYGFMTDEEKGVYNYLYNKHGKDAANRFLNDLDVELNDRLYRGSYLPAVESLKESGAAGQIAASALTVAAEPVRTITSFMSLGEDALRTVSGKGIDTNSRFRRASNLTRDIRGTIAQDMDARTNGRKILGFSAGDLYGAVMSALDSAVNVAVGAGLAQDFQSAGLVANNLKGLRKATNVISSALMSSEAASLGIADAKRKGWSDMAALTRGVISGGIEYASELIGGEWALKIIKNKPVSFINYIIRTIIPEGAEEVMSDAANEAVDLLTDMIWNTDESVIRQYMDQFTRQGSANPALDTVKAIWRDEWKSFAGGALSAVGSGATHYSNYKTSAVNLANQLHTDTATLGQFMDETGMDLEELGIQAELSDAASIDELRDSLDKIDAASASIDEINRHFAERKMQQAVPQAEAEPGEQEEYREAEYADIGDFAKEYPEPQKVTDIFNRNPGTTADEFAVGFRRAYDMGRSGVGENRVTEETAPGLSEDQRKAAFGLGRGTAAAQAQTQSAKVQAEQKQEPLKRKEGTVKLEGTDPRELRKTLNDSQNTAYRVLSYFAKTSGVNIVLYQSQADEEGNFPSEQGRFQWKDDTIYIDLNAGLQNAKDANELGKYTMLRVFGHEFTHFVEKWNAEEYNSFREKVFAVMESRGENVHDLIEAMQARDESGKMSYEQASREVLAESMMDILEDSTLVQQLANENPSLFRQLLNKLREFAARIKQAYRQMTATSPREARVLKENGAYLDSIVKMWEDAAKGAIANYQGAKAETVAETKAEQVPVKKEKAASPKASKRVNASDEASEASKNIAPETRPAGMDFFKTVEETGEEAAPDLRQMAAQRNQPVGRERFPANDLTSRAEQGPDLKGMVQRAESVPKETAEPQEEAESEISEAEARRQQLVNVYISNITNAARKAGIDLRAFFDATADMNGFGLNETDLRVVVQTLSPVVTQLEAQGDTKARSYLNEIAKQAGMDETPTRKGSADAFSKGDIFNEKQVKKAAETPAARKIIEKMTKAEEPAAQKPKSRFPLQKWRTGTPSQKAAYRILTEYLRAGKGMPSTALYAICDEAFGGTQAEGAYNRKDAYDSMELAVNQYITETMRGYNEGTVENAKRGVELAQRILSLLPTQNVRTQEQLDYQQFSTPPSIAYLAAWAANINKQDHILEPSAGIGGLAAFAKAWGAEVTVNELSKRRYGIIRAMGFDHYFNENAEHINDVLPDDIKPTVVIMNPPFSSTAGRTKSNKTSNAELHINSALDRLSDGGRLVAIVGRGMADDKYAKYWNKLRQEYTIRANIGIDGKNYVKYGTSFDVQIVVIDKTGPQGSVQTVTGQYEDLSEIPAVLEGIRNDRSAEIEREPAVQSDLPAAGQAAEGQPVRPAVAERDAADRGRAEPGDRTDAGRSGEHGGADVQRTGRSADPVQNAGPAERGTVQQQRPGEKVPGDRKADGKNKGLRPDAGADRAAADVQGQSEQQRRGPEPEPARGGQVEQEAVSDDGVYATYNTPPLTTTGSRRHPAVLVESAAMAAVDMPKATYTPHLPENVVKNNLSDAQMVSVIYAGQAHEQKLPNGERRGFFIGDGTGVGKGRQISGIILDNFEQGRKKAIWISEKQSLYNDAQRDWTDTTGRSKDEVKSLARVKVDKSIDYTDGIVFTTYDTLRGGSKTKSRVQQLADWFGADYDGVIAFDEAHNMGNLLGKAGKFGKATGSAKAIAAVELQRLLPNARVVYVSATAATEVDGLAFASRLGLWGKGTAFSDVKDFVSKIGSSGLSAMELVVRDMKAMGMYVARSISYNGVEYGTVQHDLDPVQTQIYNTMSRAWQNTMRSVEQSLADTGAQHNAKAKQNAIGQYFSAIQRFYNQVLTSMSMPSVIADMKKQLADGKSCVLQIVNTNQAEADRQMANIKAEGGELDEMDLTPRGTLIDYLMKYYPVTKFEEYEDDNGNLRSRPVENSKGEPVVDKKAVAKRDALIAEINEMSIPDGPLEMLFDAFGTENVAEITGRTRRVVPRKQADGSIKRVEEKRTPNSREADVTAFQNGDKRILVFNNAGGTGKSYHADNRAKNKQQRVHYVLQPGWEASRAVQGFGRTHRSNEASAPVYKLVTTNIKGQKRFTSTIARRLDQLGALTKGQRDTGSGMFGASDNLETDLAKDSLREFYRRLGTGKLEGINGRDVLQKLGLLEKFTGEYGEFKMNDAVARDISKFLNRILALEVDEQNEVFDAFIRIYETEMDAAIAAGTLDRGMENVKADKIEIVDDKVIKEQKGTGAATHYVQAKVYTKPKLISTVAEAEKIRSGFQGIYRTNEGAVRAVYRIADKTTEWGAVTKQYKIQSPNRSKSSVWQERTLESNAELLPKSEWQQAWDEEISKQPEYNEDIKHMLTGSLLPIWDALPEEGNTRVQRLITDDGKAYLGRIINAEQIDGVLRRFDVNRTKETYTGKSLMQKARNSDTVFNLTYQRAKIHRSRVSGEWRLEYEQPFNTFTIQQQYPDMMMERINYQNRFFIPMNEKGEALLDKLLEANPVSSTTERGEDRVEYSIRRTEKKSYKEQIHTLFHENGNGLYRDDDLFVSKPIHADSEIGIAGKPFFMLRRNFTKSTREKGTNANYSSHAISEKTMLNIPAHIQSPALYVVSDGRVSILADERVKTQRTERAPLLIGVDPNAKVDGRDANEIKSIYGVDNIELWLKTRAANSRFYAVDEKKAADLFRMAGLQLSRPVSGTTDLTESIREQFGIVNSEEEFSTRRESLSNREVLTMAAAEIDNAALSEAERNALDLFQTRLNRLEEAQEKRAELGREYRGEQFTKGGSRAEAEKIRNRMQVYDERIQRLQNELLSLENKDVLRRVLTKARGIVEAEERRRGNETLQRYRARRNESDAARKYRARVKADAETLRKWLVNPSNKDVRKHVPAEIQKTVADFLDSINLMSKTAIRTGGLETTKADEQYLKNMKKLHDAIKENVDVRGLYSGYADLPADFLDNFEAMIRKAEQHIDENPGVFVVNQMSAGELKALSQALRTLKKYITTMNMLHRNAMFAHVDEAGDSTVQHLSKFKKSAKSGTAYKFLRFDYMRPSYAFEHFGKGGQSIEHEFREGQATQAFLAKKIIEFAKKTYTGKEVKAWGEHIKTFTLSGGEKISMPVTHLMSLYCLNKRAQARTHIYGDGIRVANYKADGKVQLDEGHLLSMEDVQKMLKELTPRQRSVADALQRYMSTECAEWGNYVSMARFDVEQFGEDNYFPINSDGRYLPATADESPDNAGLYALLNMGFTKELKENAKNRIILYNIFDVFANHTASMTQYRSFALPVLDALKWFNYKNESTSVRDQLASAFGAPEESRAGSGSKGYAESFVLNLIRAYNGTSAQGDPYDSFGMKGLHRFNRAQIAFNLRVVAQQPTAITRAAMLLNPGRLMQGLGKSAAQMKTLSEEMERYSGIAYWKRLGFYDTNVSRGLTELIKQNPDFGDKITEIGTKGAEMADRYTWAAMWYAAKKSVNRSSYATEDAYMKAVTELFEDVIYKTQVVDSVLTKSEFLRAKGFFPRMLGSFMSEPMTTISMLADAHFKYTDDMQRGMSRSEAWQRNGKNITKTLAVYGIGQIILAAAQAFMDAWRDDDEYDTEHWFSNYFQKWLNAFKNNVIEELLPFGKIPLVSELYEFMKDLMDYAGLFDKWGLDLYGNDLSNGWAQYAKYLKKAAEITLDKTGVTGNKTNYTWWGAVYNLLRGASGLTGYPAATLWREIQDLWNNTVGYSAPSLKLDTYQRAIDRTYAEQIRPTGLAQKAFEKMLDDADVNGESNPTQDELGEYLVAALDRGDITKEQADAVWASRGWKADHDFAWWLGGKGKAETTAAKDEAPKTQVEPQTGKTSSAVNDYDSFKKTAPVYHDKLESAYEHWQSDVAPLGISLEQYTNLLIESDTDNNGSVKQDEMGRVLTDAIQRGELNMGQAGVIWRTLWNGGRSKTYADWLKKNK